MFIQLKIHDITWVLLRWAEPSKNTTSLRPLLSNGFAVSHSSPLLLLANFSVSACAVPTWGKTVVDLACNTVLVGEIFRCHCLCPDGPRNLSTKGSK